jgi:hypothetical protein
VTQAPQRPHQGKQGSDDGVAEHDVEQELPVRPPGAVREASQVLGRGAVDELVELGQGSPHLDIDLVWVHAAASATRLAPP